MGGLLPPTVVLVRRLLVLIGVPPVPFSIKLVSP
jgi:hypothetical protein